jgi:rod shape-determining protein MreD
MAVVAVVQVTITSHFRIFGVTPDLVLLCAISWVLLQGVRDGVLASLVGGIVLDALSGAPFGLMTLTLFAVSYLGGMGELNIFRTAKFLPYLAIALATFVYGAVLLFLLGMVGRPIAWGLTLWRVVLPEVVINVLSMPIVYTLVRWLRGRAYPKPVQWE